MRQGDEKQILVKTIAQWYSAGYGLDNRWFESRQRLGIFLFTTASRQAWGPPSLLSNGYQGLFPGE
jgi:hypothetical protein